jgi:hypothetical protein
MMHLLTASCGSYSGTLFLSLSSKVTNKEIPRSLVEYCHFKFLFDVECYVPFRRECREVCRVFYVGELLPETFYASFPRWL